MEQNYEEKVEQIPKSLLIFNMVVIVLICIFAVAIYTSATSKRFEAIKQIEEVKALNPFNKVEVLAKSAYVIDVVSGQVLYKKNEFVQLPLASVTKLMTALVSKESVTDDFKIKINREALLEEGDSGLLVGEVWKLKNLLDFSLLVSSNDGVRVISTAVGVDKLKTADLAQGRQYFIDQMNQRARDLGLKQTYFINESGLDEGNTSGGYGSAIDVAELLKYITKKYPTLLEATRYETMTLSSETKKHTAKNTNIDIHSIPNLLTSKTGFTDMAGGNLAIVFDSSIGRPVVVVVLGSTQDGRFTDVGKLVQSSIQYITNN